MFKLGRGGGGRGSGRGGGKRPPQAPPLGGKGGGRGPIGGLTGTSRGRGGVGAVTAATASAAPGRDETFILESGGPLDFAAVIRLAPDLVEEIGRVEAQGGAARIKFGSNSNGHSENVIDVGGKEFRFTWSREFGHCDIYEECQNGEDGNGLLIERGFSWRKLNVERILDESTKNHVKMRSEEAERQSKSRKSIVLDPANPSVKSQASSMVAAAVEGNMRRMGWKRKKENFFKKREFKSSQAPIAAPPKTVSKTGIFSNNANKGIGSVSPVLSPPDQSGPSNAIFSHGTSKDLAVESNNEYITTLNINKEEKGKAASMVVHGVQHQKSGYSVGAGDKPMDLRSFLIALLSENSKGMSLKALEKVVGDSFPGPSKNIEAIIKTIAIFHAPGRYLLKPGFGANSSQRHASDSGSSPENVPYQPSDPEAIRAEIVSHEKKAAFNLNVEELATESIDIGGSPNSLIGDGKVNNESDGRASSSSESSDSASDSESSDSASDRSRSRSPVGSGSGSSSDSESDDSSSSKEASDVLVDIMSDDEKEAAAHKSVPNDLKISSPPRDWRIARGESEHDDFGINLERKIKSPQLNANNFEIGIDEATHAAARNKNKKLSESPEIGNTKATWLDPLDINERLSEGEIPLSIVQEKNLKGHQTISGKITGKSEAERFMNQSLAGNKTKDESLQEPSTIADRSLKSKPKRSYPSENNEKPDRAKKPKAANLAETISSGKGKGKGDPSFLEKPHYSSPSRFNKEQHTKETHHDDWNVHIDIGFQDRSPAMNGRSMASGNLQWLQKSPDYQTVSAFEEHPSQKLEKLSGRKKITDCNVEYSDGGNKQSAEYPIHRIDPADSATKNRNMYDKPSVPNENTHIKDINSDINDTYLIKGTRENIAGDKIPLGPDAIGRNGQPSWTQKTGVEKSPAAVKGVLQRELSDLELGEFREPLTSNELGVAKRRFEKNAPYKSSENKAAIVDNSSSSNISKGRTAANFYHEQGKLSPPNMGNGVLGNQDAFHMTVPTNNLADSTRAQQRLQFSRKMEQPISDAISYLDRTAEMVSKNETRAIQAVKLDPPSANKKNSAVRLPQHDYKHGGQITCNIAVESKTEKSNALGGAVEPSNKSFAMNNVKVTKSRDSSSDEDNFFFSKYDKDEPELKGPIKDFLQYKEYVQEYQDKYEIYIHLNKKLKKTGDIFLRAGHDLELAEGRDMEEYDRIVKKLRDMYRQHGQRHKLMKKVFVILHEELKTVKQKITDFADAYTKE